MKNIFNKPNSVAESFHDVRDLNSLLSAITSTAPTIEDKDAPTYLTLAKSIAGKTGLNLADTERTSALDRIANGSQPNSRLNWLATFEKTTDLETLKNAVVKTSEKISDDLAVSYAEDLKKTMVNLGFNLDPNADKEDRDPASTIFAVLHGSSRKSFDLQIIAASEVGLRVSGDAKKLWADELADLEAVRQKELAINAPKPAYQ